MLRLTKNSEGCYEVDVTAPGVLDKRAGIKVTANYKGIEVFGWYDSFVGIDDPKQIPWADVDQARELLNNSRKGGSNGGK